MANEDHVVWLYGGKTAWNERRRIVDFEPDLSGLDFTNIAVGTGYRETTFAGFNLSKADLRGAKLAGQNFQRANFRDANLADADLSDGDFNRARFDRADLRGAKTDGARFHRANFHQTTLDPGQLEAILLADERAGGPFDDYMGEFPLGSKAPPLAPDAEFAGYQQAIPEKEPTYLVLYATNRAPTWGSSAMNGVDFGDGRGKALNFGAAQILVPKSHEIGSSGSPFWKRLFKGDNRLKVRRITTLNGDLHWESVARNFSGEPGSSLPTILIHGFNTTFEDSLLWAAQIGSDLGLQRGVSLFSWPSAGKLTSYSADEAAVEASKHYLADYLMEYMEHTTEGINVIAHSMGCRCLASALEIIGLKDPSKLKRFNEIIFAAADVDQDVMRHSTLHVVANVGRTTSYVCQKDLALSVSGWLHGYARVGLLPPVFLAIDIDTIEVTKSALFDLGHGYVADARLVLTDIFELITRSSPPAKRFALEEVSIGSGHWRVKS